MDNSIKVYLSNFSGYYPGILEWYSGLKDELLSGQRSVFVSLRGSEIQGLAITKNGLNAKLCHISVSSAARDRGIGGTLMRLALEDMKRKGAREIHVTTGEEILRKHGDFFRFSGFSLIDWHLNRYRRGISELIWTLTVESESSNFEVTNLYDSQPHPGVACKGSLSFLKDSSLLHSRLKRYRSNLNVLDWSESIDSLICNCAAYSPFIRLPHKALHMENVWPRVRNNCCDANALYSISLRKHKAD